MKKEKRIRLIIYIMVIILTLILASIIGINYINSKKSSNNTKEVEVDDVVLDYGYELMENATTYYKELFNKLKILLSNSDFDEKEYAKLVGQMFAADFYNLDNKVSNSDIGGVGFVNKEYQNNFKLAAQNSIYGNVLNNVYNDRNQELPIVKSVEVNSIINTGFGSFDSSAYKLNLSIVYENDLGYPKDVTLIIIHSNNKLEIAQVG